MSVSVKNLLTVLSSTGGRLGSTQVAATEDKVSDERAEETHSKESINDVDQHLVDDWWCTSDGGNDDKKNYTRCIECGKRSAQCREGSKWTV